MKIFDKNVWNVKLSVWKTLFFCEGCLILILYEQPLQCIECLTKHINNTKYFRLEDIVDIPSSEVEMDDEL